MPTKWIGSAIAAGLFLVFILLWHGSAESSLFAQTVEALRDVRTYACRITAAYPSLDGDKTETVTMKRYWAAPGSVRTDTYKEGKLSNTRILSKDKPGVDIDHLSQTFHRLEPWQGFQSPLLLMDRLANYSGDADAVLKEMRINNKAAPGFEVRAAKIDPDVGEGSVRVWTDPKTKLPLRFELTKEAGRIWIWDEFQWDSPSEKWFALEPPAHYREKTATPRDVETVTKQIVAGLKTYVKHSGGKYPQVKMVYGDVTWEELNRHAGLPPRTPPEDPALRKVWDECFQAMSGFTNINGLQRQSRDAVYHGKTVGPRDEGKVLFRWRLSDGRFRVIYGDLRVEDVSEARLKTLEGE